jgi:D-alanyl-D-alanine carboxypeptidase (penicillin-binding protein 5/6)
LALAEHVAGTEEGFATLMNQHAQDLGMANSHFTNSTGLPDPDLYVTAHDIALLARAIIMEFPEYYAWYSIKEFSYNNITQFNRNLLLWRDQGVDGVKTGHTDSAGFCLVASALRDGMRLVSVVLGTKDEKSRAQESLALLNYGFRFFETHRLYAAGQELYTLQVWKGAERNLRLGLNTDLYVTVPRGQYTNLSASMDMHAHIIAPVAKGQSFGNVNVSLAGDVIAKPPLVALHEVAQGSLWRRLIDSIRLWWN